jgi:hypothetical protein
VREVDACKKLRDDLHSSMQKTEKDIGELKDRVAHERVVRQHKEEYALLAQKVTQYDSRSKTQSDNDAIQVSPLACARVRARELSGLVPGCTRPHAQESCTNVRAHALISHAHVCLVRLFSRACVYPCA